MRLTCILVFLIVLSAGCIQQEMGEEFTDSGATTSTAAPDTSQALKDTTSTTLKIPVTTTSITLVSNQDQLEVEVRLCTTDDYGNAAVAGYVTNEGSVQKDVVAVSASLEQEGEIVVEKKLVVGSVGAGASRQFMVVFEDPPEWSKCDAQIILVN